MDYNETILLLILARIEHLEITKQLVAQDVSIQDIDKERTLEILSAARASAEQAILDEALTKEQATQALSDLTVLNLRLRGHLK